MCAGGSGRGQEGSQLKLTPNQKRNKLVQITCNNIKLYENKAFWSIVKVQDQIGLGELYG